MRIAVVLLASIIAAPALAQSLTVPPDPIVRGATEDYLRPGFHALAVASDTLKTSVDALCATPSSETLDAVKAAFTSTAIAYAHVEFARLGPLEAGDGAERLLFWPDTKGIALRQVQATLATKDPSVLDPATLRPKSVAMQGLLAAEFLLFATGSDTLAGASPDGTYRCGYLDSIAVLVDGIAADIDREWQDSSPAGYAQQMRAPSPDGVFRTPDEVVQKLMQVLSVGNETIRDRRVSPILGAAEGAPKPKSALFWRSGLTVQILAADYAGLRALFDAASLASALGKAGSASTADSIVFEFDTAARAAALVTSPIDAAVADPDQLRHLKELVFVSRSLDTLFGQNMSDALGITNGFSLLDGD